MTRVAVISDIHGNLHALQAVIDRIAQLGVEDILCLGDIVGYGPFPEQCLDLVMKNCSLIVRGNHDDAVIDPAVANTFNGAAKEAIDWTRKRLGPLHMNAILRIRATADYATQVMCVHSCPVPGPTDYVHDHRMAAMAFRGMHRPICLLGHTHIPIVFSADASGPLDDLSVEDVSAFPMTDESWVPLEDGRKYICNPGSVGQPRDADPRASFALLDLKQMTFTVLREPYDIDAAQMATQRAGLPFILAERLAIGA